MEPTNPKREMSLHSSDVPDDSATSNARSRKTSDSMYSSEGSSTSRTDLDKNVNNSSSKRAGSSDEDDFSQLHTKSTARSRRARRLPNVTSQSTDDESTSPARPTNPSDSQYSSEDSRAKRNLKREGSADLYVASRSEKSKHLKATSSSIEKDRSKPGTRKIRRRRKPQQLSSSSDESQNKEELSETSNSGGRNRSDQSDNSELEMSNTRRRKKAQQLWPLSSDESQNKKELSEKSRSESPSSSDQSDHSQPPSESSNSESSLYESDGSEIETKRSRKRKQLSDTDEDDENSEAGSVDNSGSEKSNFTPKKSNITKYKKVQVSNSSDESEEDKELPKESPLKIINRELIYKQLDRAIKFNSLNKVRDIIFSQSPEGLDAPEFSKLLWVALEKKNAEIVTLLVRAKVNINLRGPNENDTNTVLQAVAEVAWRKGYEDLALLLMSRGADINSCNGDGNTVLCSAVKGGSVRIVEELLRREVDVGQNYNRILRVAAEAESHLNPASILPLLIEYKAPDMETKDRRAMHALRCLVRANGDLTAMKVLLECILPLNEIDDEGSTLLHRAVFDSHYEMVELLLEHGADPRCKRRDGSPPLCLAVCNQTSRIAGLLIKHGASVDDRNVHGQYPIDRACNFQSVENIRLLLHFGARINVTDNFLETTPFSKISNPQYLKDATKLIIQQLALLRSKNVEFDNRDLIKIREYPVMRKYYARCLCELEKLKTVKIFRDISVYSILNYDVNKISHLVKNSEFIDQYYKNKKEIEGKATVYFSAVHRLMKIAWLRRDKLNTIENTIREASNNVLPDEIYEKIAYLACYDSLIDFDLKEIASS